MKRRDWFCFYSIFFQHISISTHLASSIRILLKWVHIFQVPNKIVFLLSVFWWWCCLCDGSTLDFVNLKSMLLGVLNRLSASIYFLLLLFVNEKIFNDGKKKLVQAFKRYLKIVIIMSKNVKLKALLCKLSCMKEWDDINGIK